MPSHNGVAFAQDIGVASELPLSGGAGGVNRRETIAARASSSYRFG
jgi:hypothetical protein